MSDPVTVSVLTCPQCGFARQEAMPTDACQFFYECTNCKVLLRPKPGDCCVFCSFGSVKCPPVQIEDGGCSQSDTLVADPAAPDGCRPSHSPSPSETPGAE